MCAEERHSIWEAFTAEAKLQLATPTSELRKRRNTPTLVNPVHCKLLGRVECDRDIEDTTASKKKKASEDTTKASKKKASKPASGELRSLDEKW